VRRVEVEAEKRRKASEMANSSEGTGAKSGNVPKWDGREGSFPMWYRQFRAYCTVKDCKEALEEGGESDLPGDENENVGENKGKQAALRRNALAMSYLTMALDDYKLMAYLQKGETPEYREGLAHLVWSALMKKMEPKDGLSKVDAIKKLFNVSKREGDDDPTYLFDEVRRIEARYNTATSKMSDELLLAAVVIQADSMYDDVIASEQRNKGDKLTLDDLEEAMTTLYRVKQHGVDKDDGDEFGFAGVSDQSVKCHRCGGIGHRIAECPSDDRGARNRKQRGEFKFYGRCHNCNEKGHMARDCNQASKEAEADERAGVEIVL